LADYLSPLLSARQISNETGDVPVPKHEYIHMPLHVARPYLQIPNVEGGNAVSYRLYDLLLCLKT
jgi:hypothetical protein